MLITDQKVTYRPRTKQDPIFSPTIQMMFRFKHKNSRDTPKPNPTRLKSMFSRIKACHFQTWHWSDLTPPTNLRGRKMGKKKRKAKKIWSPLSSSHKPKLQAGQSPLLELPPHPWSSTRDIWELASNDHLWVQRAPAHPPLCLSTRQPAPHKISNLLCSNLLNI